MLLSQERPVVTQILREHPYALFIFSNLEQDHWHFINVKYDTETEKRRLFRRISISPEERLHTASKRLALIDLQSINPDLFGLPLLEIQEKHDEAFDVEAVTKQFFREYEEVFKILEKDLIRQTNNHTWAHDYSLQFLNRSMFIYFIQRKGWLGKDPDFLLNFWKSYGHSKQNQDLFVDDWLKVLFFEAFNNGFHGGHKYFPKDINDILSLAPYLNGGLFTENPLDREYKVAIADKLFEQILKFLERYNFTIAEDSPLDKEVAVDPEMIGKVYESLVNVSEEVDERGEAGIFYTPRTEIDLMCRLSLVNYLANYLGEDKKSLFYQLVFALEPDEKVDADRAIVGASLWTAVNERLHDITVLDPACGSGSFLVGMLSILDDLQQRANEQLKVDEDSFTRKKRIIGQSLYGVDVMEWACHVAELRLWLALIIDAEIPSEELHVRKEPLLPYFTFKIRSGDSLVQEVGGINLGHIKDSREIPPQLKTSVTKLKNEKLKFYNNDKTCKFHSAEALKNEERQLFINILAARKDEIHKLIQALRRKIEGPQEQQVRLDGSVTLRSHQMDLEVGRYQQELDVLNKEFAQTEASLKALGTAREMPFVWDIAFVEIFEGEKEGFDIVIGNPPYVRQEAIADPHLQREEITTENKRIYKDKLARSVYQAFARFFGYQAGSAAISRKIDAKSDLYIYFYFLGLKLLNTQGSFCFITSNSWLDVGYGADLQEFLLKHSQVKLVLDNQMKRTFANADVNSVIVLLSSPDDRREWALENTARFVMFLVPFEHILSAVIFDEIEEATEHKETKEYRVFPIRQDKLLEDGCELPDEEIKTGKSTGPLIKVARYIGNKWGGKYLRAPDIYWTILEKGKGKLVRLGDIAEVRRGFTTGANEFFYLDKEGIEEWGIEEEFLKPVISSTSEIHRLIIHQEDSKTFLFSCSLTIEQLKKQGFRGAMSYIAWGATQQTRAKGKHTIAGVLLQNAPSVRSHTPDWYCIQPHEPGVFIVPRLIRERFFFADNPDGISETDMFFHGYVKNHPRTVSTLLNCTFTYLTLEILGRQGIEGRFNVYGPELAQVMITDPQRLSVASRLSIEENFQKVGGREIQKIVDEVKQSDRHTVDNIIFDVLGLTQGERDAVYEAVINLVEARLKKAGSLG